LLRYEKWLNLFCWIIIIASVVIFLPVTISAICK
jgi:hypothetical protein